MRRKSLVLILALAVVGVLAVAPSAESAPIGPICFSTLPFADVLVWFVNASGSTPNAIYFDGNGRDLSGDRTQSVSMHINAAGTILSFGYTTHPKPGAVPVIAGGTVNISTLSGPGQCFSPDLASCGAFTMKIIACPANASEPAGTSGPVQGKE